LRLAWDRQLGRRTRHAELHMAALRDPGRHVDRRRRAVSIGSCQRQCSSAGRAGSCGVSGRVERGKTAGVAGADRAAFSL
jgi:hypothetical protein